ncbi:hypothetical protein HIM_05138 [Hirsutella minnesotensis 3608]|uniref:ARCA protein n=1 Tax=Hirsutella minnesotensis 3608 TaxID=1043627 RepID=A0A0F8A0L4_9HYPO|nr:hypothetical protein HIM_05138 [Hirsutella minnesotensis 3608]
MHLGAQHFSQRSPETVPRGTDMGSQHGQARSNQTPDPFPRAARRNQASRLPRSFHTILQTSTAEASAPSVCSPASAADLASSVASPGAYPRPASISLSEARRFGDEGTASGTGPASAFLPAVTGPDSAPALDQEAALLRFFIEKLSPWFDLCDEQSHFERVVPLLASRHAHLRWAISAVAARHLCRLPEHRTSLGVSYHGLLLPNLSPSTAVECLLKCIPSLWTAHEVQDLEHLESLVATAVILRQLEEIEADGLEDMSTTKQCDTGEANHRNHEEASFLPITNAVLQNAFLQDAFHKSSLIQASYWMALRQEIYHSFTRQTSPKIDTSLDFRAGVSEANKLILYTARVAKWRWGSTMSQDEWTSLREQETAIRQHELPKFQPLLKRSPDRSSGEMFPMIWYRSTEELIAIQHLLIAQMVLRAEDPRLREEPRESSLWKSVETEVSSMILDICGISNCHPHCPPALVNAAIALQLYGDFFVEDCERQALKSVVERFKSAHAWPLRDLGVKFL